MGAQERTMPPVRNRVELVGRLDTNPTIMPCGQSVVCTFHVMTAMEGYGVALQAGHGAGASGHSPRRGCRRSLA